MVRSLDVAQALYGLSYDLARQVEQHGNPETTLLWLEDRVRRLRKDVENWRKYNGGERPEPVKQYVKKYKETKITSQAMLDRKKALWGDS